MEIILFRTPTQVNAPWVLPPKADPPLAETQLLTEATPNPKQSQAPPWLFPILNLCHGDLSLSQQGGWRMLLSEAQVGNSG